MHGQLSKIRRYKANEILEKEINFKPDVVELILKLKNLGFILALATMTTHIQLSIYSKKNEIMLQQMNIEKIFDYITTQDDVKCKKPNPEIYNKIMKRYKAKPEECLIFEDSYTGVLAAKNAGIEVVNIWDKYADLDREKINEITDYSINNYKEFIDLVNQLYPKISENETNILEK